MDELTKIENCIANTKYEITELYRRIEGLQCKLNTLELMKEEALLNRELPFTDALEAFPL